MPIPSPHEPSFDERVKFELDELIKTNAVIDRLRDAHAAHTIHILGRMHSSRASTVTSQAVESIKILEALDLVHNTIEYRIYDLTHSTITSRSTSTTTGIDLFGRTDILHKGT